MNARLPSWQRDPRLEWNHDSQVAMAAVAAPPAASHAAAAPPQIDLSDSDSISAPAFPPPAAAAAASVAVDLTTFSDVGDDSDGSRHRYCRRDPQT